LAPARRRFHWRHARWAEEKPIQGFEKTAANPKDAKEWKAISDRKIRVGLVGYGVCKFSAALSFRIIPTSKS
jgi:hypothetical protein